MTSLLFPKADVLALANAPRIDLSEDVTDVKEIVIGVACDAPNGKSLTCMPVCVLVGPFGDTGQYAIAGYGIYDDVYAEDMASTIFTIISRFYQKDTFRSANVHVKLFTSSKSICGTFERAKKERYRDTLPENSRVTVEMHPPSYPAAGGGRYEYINDTTRHLRRMLAQRDLLFAACPIIDRTPVCEHPFTQFWDRLHLDSAGNFATKCTKYLSNFTYDIADEGSDPFVLALAIACNK